MKVNQIMTKDLTAVDEEISVRELIFILKNSELSNMPIVDAEGKLAGFISDKDVIKAALPGYFEMLHSTSFIPDMNQLSNKLAKIADNPIKTYMHRDVICLKEDDDDLQAADLIIRRNVRSLPVINSAGKLVGILRRIDLLRHLL
ncbi:MAG: CBS domain-containing protein [Candidatus Bipolaricaulota bacterium]|nr:CBS domain-containing protein [Candidatus Bipolaricaulota bacterium]